MVTINEQPVSPISAWFASFKDNFQFSPWTWFKGLAGNLGAFFYKLVTKAPIRILRWVQHLFSGLIGLFRWLLIEPFRGFPAESGTQESPPLSGFRVWLLAGLGGAGIWLMRLFFKTLELVSIGELLNTLSMLVKFNTRPLTEYETSEAKKVFGNCLTYWRIRIDEWSLVAHIGNEVYKRRTKRKSKGMAITIFNTIHFTRRIHPDTNVTDMAWLVHELTHTTQCEFLGGQFMIEALIAQGREGYDYGGASSLEGRNFEDFNREQQGDIARDYYLYLVDQKKLETHEAAEYERVILQMQAGKV